MVSSGECIGDIMTVRYQDADNDHPVMKLILAKVQGLFNEYHEGG